MKFQRITMLAAAAAVLGLTACTQGGTASGGNSGAATTQQPTTTTTPPAAAAGEFGPACSAVPKDGPGSFQGMAKDPVATAASNNPVLSTLVAAVKQAGLVDTLNTAQNITVFAPTNDAFAKIPKDTLDKVLADKAMLTQVLTYHVVPKRLSPAELATGSFTTLQEKQVKTTGSGQEYKVNNASVVCGNVQTGNATVYLIDSVLMPPAS